MEGSEDTNKWVTILVVKAQPSNESKLNQFFLLIGITSSCLYIFILYVIGLLFYGRITTTYLCGCSKCFNNIFMMFMVALGWVQRPIPIFVMQLTQFTYLRSQKVYWVELTKLVVTFLIFYIWKTLTL